MSEHRQPPPPELIVRGWKDLSPEWIIVSTTATNTNSL